MQACRDDLRSAGNTASHAGLLLAYYLRETGDKGVSKRNLLKDAIAASRRVRDVYRLAFERWEHEIPHDVTRKMEVRGRLAIGLGGASVLETGLTLHHTYGTPLIPGTSLKGLAAHYCHEVWGLSRGDPNFQEKGDYHSVLFGQTEDAGHIVFHDAWITPDSLSRDGLALDVMTPHHQRYYADGSEPPSDFDDPIPVSFLSVTGTFRLAISCDVAGAAQAQWTGLAMDLLSQALSNWGAGGKTNAGYGRMQPRN